MKYTTKKAVQLCYITIQMTHLNQKSSSRWCTLLVVIVVLRPLALYGPAKVLVKCPLLPAQPEGRSISLGALLPYPLFVVSYTGCCFLGLCLHRQQPHTLMYTRTTAPSFNSQHYTTKAYEAMGKGPMGRAQAARMQRRFAAMQSRLCAPSKRGVSHV